MLHACTLQTYTCYNLQPNSLPVDTVDERLAMFVASSFGYCRKANERPVKLFPGILLLAEIKDGGEFFQFSLEVLYSRTLRLAISSSCTRTGILASLSSLGIARWCGHKEW